MHYASGAAVASLHRSNRGRSKILGRTRRTAHKAFFDVRLNDLPGLFLRLRAQKALVDHLVEQIVDLLRKNAKRGLTAQRPDKFDAARDIGGGFLDADWLGVLVLKHRHDLSISRAVISFGAFLDPRLEIGGKA